jgi:hypothetical protein
MKVCFTGWMKDLPNYAELRVIDHLKQKDLFLDSLMSSLMIVILKAITLSSPVASKNLCPRMLITSNTIQHMVLQLIIKDRFFTPVGICGWQRTF